MYTCLRVTYFCNFLPSSAPVLAKGKLSLQNPAPTHQSRIVVRDGSGIFIS